jgi:hypothetical protein
MVNAILIETRTEFAIGTAIFWLRWFCRWKAAPISKWAIDDWFSICAWFFWVVLIAIVEYLGN